MTNSSERATQDLINDFTTIPTAKDMLAKDVRECGEKMINLEDELSDIASFRVPSYLVGSKENCFLARESIAKMVRGAYKDLTSINKDMRFLISNCYRSYKTQCENFEKMLKRVRDNNPDLSEEDLIEKANMMIAYPEVAGHVTGGAIDLSIEINGQEIDMGAIIGDFSKEELLFVKTPHINEKQFQNRMLLRECMIKNGFSPFNGEWWHFCYGDREWACFRNKEYAIYSPYKKE